MKRTIILLFTFFCSFFLDAWTIEVRTRPPVSHKASDRAHYAEFAKRFSDTLRKHPGVSDCHVVLHTTDTTGLINRIEIAVEFDREALINHIKELRNLRFVTQKEQERYLQSFGSVMKAAAKEIFADVELNGIVVTVVVK